MRFIVDFSIAAFAYLAIIVIVYSCQPKVDWHRSRLYGSLLVLGLLGLMLDVATALLDGYGLYTPHWILYAVNILFLWIVQTMAYLFFLYALVLLGLWRQRTAVLAGIPLIVVTLLLLASPVTRHGVFWIDQNGGYQYGTMHTALYVASGIYLAAVAVIVRKRRRWIQPYKSVVILAFLVITLGAMAIQLMIPGALVNNMATALALTMMYYALEAPIEHVDALTGAFNATALTARLTDLLEQNQRFSVVGFRLDSLPAINETMGEARGDEVLTLFADVLKGCFPKGQAVRFLGNVFVVLLSEPIDGRNALKAIAQRVEKAWQARDDVSLHFWCYGVNSAGFESPDEIVGLLRAMQDERGGGTESVLLADKEYDARRQYHRQVEDALRRALDSDALLVYYQPIHDAEGRLVALESLVRLTDEKLGTVPPEVFIPLAEQNGSIGRLGETVLRKTCAYIKENRLDAWGLEHVGVNLSIIQCMAEGMAAKVDEIVREAGVKPEMLGLELTETETASALPTVRQNMEALSQGGYRFVLDDFGLGNANFRYLMQLPFSCVKLDKELLWGAEKNETQRAFLSGVCSMLRKLEMYTACEGVETREQRDFLISLGVEQLQGYYFSKPLSPEALLDYAARFLAAGMAEKPDTGEVTPS